MSQKNLRVMLAQINTTVGDLRGNFDKMISAILKAQANGADLVVFPELTITGYPPEDLLFKKSFIDDNLKTLRRLIPHSKKTAFVAGFVDRDRSGSLYNAAAFMHRGRLLSVYHKQELPNYGVFDEKRYFKPGSASGAVIRFSGMSVGITICEDIWEKRSFVYKKNFRKRAQLLINISASPYHVEKQNERTALIKNLAKRTGSLVVYVNLVGGQDELVFDGGSMVADASGKIIACAGRFEEAFLPIDIPFKKKISGVILSEKTSRAEEVYKALVLGTRDYIRKNLFKKVLIGLSGGIDSALVAAIAVDALGPRNVIGVTMPSAHTSKETYSDAKLLAKNFGIQCLEFSIKDIYGGYERALKAAFAGQPKNIAEENLQARIRGNLLMALSNKWGHLVLTTGNKSEMATGYCTLYGDMAGGFAVLKDVPKTLVFQLARYRNSLEKLIPESTLRRAPTAELRPNQKDQDVLPPYPLLDKFLELYVEKDLSVKNITQKGISGKLAKKTARMVDLNEYKRRQSPPGIKITPKSFGRDRRMPITNLYDR